MQATTSWRLKRGSDKKFRSGHPWVFSSELAQSPKSLRPGALVHLLDDRGAFLAQGYGHPNSLISFRTLSLDPNATLSAEFFCKRLQGAAHARSLAGLTQFSHRLCFAEGDFLPGLIIDRYILSRGHERAPCGQVFVVQSSTAGMDLLLDRVFEALELLVKAESGDWAQTSIILANDAKSRAVEGIAVEPKKLIRQAPGFNPEAAFILLQPGVVDLQPALFKVDFINGQKTGFFLDQRSNVQIAARMVEQMAAVALKRGEPLRVLDLFCYVGQWGAQLAQVITAQGVRAEVTLMDASARALELAKANVEAHGGVAHVEKADILEKLSELGNAHYDIVICDPPAFIKKKKDLEAGKAAYGKLNREALKKMKREGLFVTCSCSGLFSEEDFREMLARTVATRGENMRWIARGSHSADHPQRPEFPQGTYLKSWFGLQNGWDYK